MAHFDVIVVGGGIVGLSVALDLANAGIDVALIDKRPLMPDYQSGPDLADYDTRVSALTRRSQHYLEKLGVWSAIVAERCMPYHNMYVWDGEGTANLSFDAASVGQQDIGHIVENRVIANALYQALLHSGVKQFAPFHITHVENVAGGVRVDSDTHSLSADLLIAADGAQSALRERLGYFCREWDYGHCGIVATVQLSRPHQHTAWQRFMQTGPLAFLPLDDEYKASIVWSCFELQSETLMALDDDDFCAALTRASEVTFGDITAIGPRQAFPLRQRHATDYVKHRCVLIGDAAHTIHPLAGQGMNLGLGDAIVLAEELTRSKQRGLGLADVQGLKRFQRRRKTENLAMMTAMEGFKRLFETRDLHVLLARNEGMRALDKLPSVKQKIVSQALGL